MPEVPLGTSTEFLDEVGGHARANVGLTQLLVTSKSRGLPLNVHVVLSGC